MDLNPVALLGGAVATGIGLAFFAAQSTREAEDEVQVPPAPRPAAADEGDPPGIQTVLDFDAIPAVFNPEFQPGRKETLPGDHPVIGVALDGEAKAYSIPLLDGHEIVNDTVGGQKVITTW